MKDKEFKNRVEEIMSAAMHNIRPFIDSDVVVGKPIENGQLKIIPLTKVSMGYVSGGGEYYSELKEIRKDNEYPFSGGAGGGVSLKPIGFLVLKNDEVELIKVESKDAIEKLIETIPEIAKFINDKFGDKNV